ncbi:gliding motility-associated C-terminal domain-containing protein [Croceitalea rosinachiae]|uniref:Gliding motility-associated C-terminal domain-containing protein n=1 Tax=Croceitalea rosinachiae TaxID=3075596 RepID=A0ABU3A957_9FLAO|nr:gliding motility-associated C-terminal domain-containing protein [Croceitalea sp. F388]MDT0606711.1 gliding motility-associated C-terminal domain-containing protein [Croceitalea sp. F388]
MCFLKYVLAVCFNIRYFLAMIRKLPLIPLLFLSFNLSAQTPILYTNFEQQLVDLGIDTYDINGNENTLIYFDMTPNGPYDFHAPITTPPLCTNLSNPANNDINVATDIPTISWNISEGATGYKVEITSTSANNNIPLTDIGNMVTYSLPETFLEGDLVTVRVVPYNTFGDAGNCSSQRFSIFRATPIPSCTTLISPINGAIDIAVDTNISWEPVDGADGYRLTIGSSSGATDVLNSEDVGILTSYSFLEELSEGKTYHITITPYNTAGDATGCMEESYTTIAELEEPEEDNEVKYGLSPNGDGVNEFWEINGIENYPNNTVVIYNRWGDMVFKIDDYDNSANVFRGEANQLTSFGAGQLPEGTYFFNLIVPENNNLKQTKGYLVLKR